MAEPSNEPTTQALLALCEDKARWSKELSAEAVMQAVARGADVNARNRYGQTALHLAVRGPYSKSDPLPEVEVVKALIDAGAEVNARDGHEQTVLVMAAHGAEADSPAESRALELIHLLRAAGATAGADVKSGQSGAFTGAGVKVLRELLDAGAAIDARTEQGLTPLHSAARGGQADHVRLLLERGAEVNAIDGLGRTPLGVALRTKEEAWVVHNKRTPGFIASIRALEAAGGKQSVPLPLCEDPFAPFPVDVQAVRAALGTRKLSFSHGFDSAQEIATGLHGFGAPDAALEMLRRVAGTLGVAPRKVQLKGPLVLRAPFFHHGDLEVEGDVWIRRAFAVTGSVVVHGVVRDTDNDSLVNILGDLKCHGLYTDGEFSVAGDLEARDVVLGYYNDHLLSAARIRARVVIEDDHAVDGIVEAEHHFDIDQYSQGYGDGVPEALQALFVAEVFEAGSKSDDGDAEDPPRLDKGELFDRISKGLPVFRT
ncbi:ankyrin repeat domain-containing protein [Myxococcus stipitatus]|uniref:ankyrin repeat domain-containing protein n=1 Tax=Myxococcus stipitatus TaxID=83455 RepID=UPI001F176FA3|nr:ankyrin repeat domain-containing protein [Myxococcus stipitatus]MCE9667769.1 ankyrin repeat domain-containing protein [Myxococcus stipitatus]